MSRENLDALLRAFDAFNRRELDVFLGLMDDEVDGESRLVALEGGHRGHTGMARWWNSLLDIFPDFTFSFEEPRVLGDVTITGLVVRGHAAGSGTSQRFGLARGQMARRTVPLRVCNTPAEAFEAAGVSE